MLVLSRQRNETIMIGDEVEVTVIDIRGDKVRLGIKAPREVTVNRKEVHEAISRENQAAARLKTDPALTWRQVSPTAWTVEHALDGVARIDFKPSAVGSFRITSSLTSTRNAEPEVADKLQDAKRIATEHLLAWRELQDEGEVQHAA